VNEAPVLADASFSLPENSANGTLVGTVAATDPTPGTPSSTRSRAATRRGLRDRPEHRRDHRGRRGGAGLRGDAELRADGEVTDAGGLTDTATVTVDLTNVNEAPVLSRRELLAAGEQRERDAGRQRGRHGSRRRGHPQYAITGGNAGGAFAIDPNTGAITVANAAALDFETTPSFALTVQVTDAGGLTDTATVTVDLTNVNEAPVLADASFSLAGEQRRRDARRRPGRHGSRRRRHPQYAITGGNAGGAFAIDPTTGAITVANAAALDFETTRASR
jgi:hypothetical protein